MKHLCIFIISVICITYSYSSTQLKTKKNNSKAKTQNIKINTYTNKLPKFKQIETYSNDNFLKKFENLNNKNQEKNKNSLQTKNQILKRYESQLENFKKFLYSPEKKVKNCPDFFLFKSKFVNKFPLPSEIFINDFNKEINSPYENFLLSADEKIKANFFSSKKIPDFSEKIQPFIRNKFIDEKKTNQIFQNKNFGKFAVEENFVILSNSSKNKINKNEKILKLNLVDLGENKKENYLEIKENDEIHYFKASNLYLTFSSKPIFEEELNIENELKYISYPLQLSFLFDSIVNENKNKKNLLLNVNFIIKKPGKVSKNQGGVGKINKKKINEIFKFDLDESELSLFKEDLKMFISTGLDGNDNNNFDKENKIQLDTAWNSNFFSMNKTTEQLKSLINEKYNITENIGNVFINSIYDLIQKINQNNKKREKHEYNHENNKISYGIDLSTINHIIQDSNSKFEISKINHKDDNDNDCEMFFNIDLFNEIEISLSNFDKLKNSIEQIFSERKNIQESLGVEKMISFLDKDSHLLNFLQKKNKKIFRKKIPFFKKNDTKNFMENNDKNSFMEMLLDKKIKKINLNGKENLENSEKNKFEDFKIFPKSKIDDTNFKIENDIMEEDDLFMPLKILVDSHSKIPETIKLIDKFSNIIRSSKDLLEGIKVNFREEQDEFIKKKHHNHHQRIKKKRYSKKHKEQMLKDLNLVSNDSISKNGNNDDKNNSSSNIENSINKSLDNNILNNNLNYSIQENNTLISQNNTLNYSIQDNNTLTSQNNSDLNNTDNNNNTIAQINNNSTSLNNRDNNNSTELNNKNITLKDNNTISIIYNDSNLTNITQNKTCDCTKEFQRIQLEAKRNIDTNPNKKNKKNNHSKIIRKIEKKKRHKRKNSINPKKEEERKGEENNIKSNQNINRIKQKSNELHKILQNYLHNPSLNDRNSDNSTINLYENYSKTSGKFKELLRFLNTIKIIPLVPSDFRLTNFTDEEIKIQNSTNKAEEKNTTEEIPTNENNININIDVIKNKTEKKNPIEELLNNNGNQTEKISRTNSTAPKITRKQNVHVEGNDVYFDETIVFNDE